MRFFLDTNILIYAVSEEPADSAKRGMALELLDGRDGVISAQVLQEFYVQATKTTRRGALTHGMAADLMETWTRFSIQETTLQIVQSALEIRGRLGFSYWDSAIIAAACAQGCRVLYSEDMSHGQKIDGVVITNPFL